MANRGAWMIYGANGYTGRLVAAEAKRLGLNPLLAGRRAGPIEKLATSVLIFLIHSLAFVPPRAVAASVGKTI